jgi:dimethylhistidine N-methyltransferase
MIAFPQLHRPVIAHDQADEFRRDVLEGLSRPAKAIPAKYLYDAQGSRLFDQICELPEYYLTRNESRILANNVGEICALAGPRAVLVEFGSGSSTKTRMLLDRAAPQVYMPIDVSRTHLEQTCASLASEYPRLRIEPVAADYMKLESLPLTVAGLSRLGFFPGSTIGNLTPAEARAFLLNCRGLLGDDGALLIGVDRRKSAATLDAAYNDSAGVTARFSLNLLTRINRELGATLDIGRFRHVAFFNGEESRIEIYLESLADQVARVAGMPVSFRKGERVHTEYSYKYTREAFVALAAGVGYAAAGSWTDAAQSFDIHLLVAS